MFYFIMCLINYALDKRTATPRFRQEISESDTLSFESAASLLTSVENVTRMSSFAVSNEEEIRNEIMGRNHEDKESKIKYYAHTESVEASAKACDIVALSSITAFKRGKCYTHVQLCSKQRKRNEKRNHWKEP